MDQLITQLINQLKGIWKYRWRAVFTAWLVAMVGWIVVYKLPDDYQSSARIYVDTQSVLQPLMAGMVMAPNVEQQVSIMSRTLISRPNVERVMRMVDMDLKAKTADDKEKLVKKLMDTIKIESTGRDNLFIISYNNEDPKIAKAVVQSLLTIFVEGSIGNKKKDNTSVIHFLDEQIKEYEGKLVVAETALKEFQQRNIGIMPRQGSDYTAQMLAVSDSLDQARLELKEAEQARDTLKKQINGDEPSLVTDDALSTISNPELDARIETMNKNLDALRLNYTELHPDVISTKRLIARLQEMKKAEAKLIKNSGDPGKNYSPMLQQLNVALAQAESNVAGMKARVTEYALRYDRLKSMSNAIPEMEAGLAQLNRDYQVNKENYEKLLERRESAKLSNDMGDTTELMTFKIIDPPTAPQSPTGPDRIKLFSLVFVAALASGFGIAFVMNQIRPAFHSQVDLRETTGLPVLGEVTKIWSVQEKIKRRKNLYAFGLSLLSLLLLYGLLFAKTALKITLF
ncbi:MAG: chain length-determining protein [Proteobacteria bacterium]|nr:chain length-determining protein [Pseudomonadota bacterium]